MGKTLRLCGDDDEEIVSGSLRGAMMDTSIVKLELRFFQSANRLLDDLFQCDDRSWEEVTIQACAGPLSSSLTRIHRLKRLTLSMVPMTEPLPLNPCLEELSLFEVSLSEEVTRSIAETLARPSMRIKKLDLTDSRFIDDASSVMARGLRDNATLEILCLSECNLMDEQISDIVGALVHHPTIRDLDISFNKCRSSGVSALARLIRSDICKLTKLSMDFQAFGEGKRIEISPILSALSSTNTCPLKQIGLGGNSLRDGDMQTIINTLCENRILQKVDLSENRFSDEGIFSLTERMSEMMGLKHLLLDDNRFGLPGIGALAEALESNTVIVEVEVAQNLKCSDAWSKVLYYTDLNWGGRRLLHEEVPVPLGLWPLLMERASNGKPEWMSRTPSAQDIIYCLIRGPAILHR